MTLRQDETDVNFIDIRPDSLKNASEASQRAIDSNRRAWEKTVRTIAYVKTAHPEDVKLMESLETIRHYLEHRI